ncbi:MAG: aminotransferase class III-fold pyridoxal phosphate-dependent enzyme, partial [Candidatus Micrarchaeota archaeon]|nr:aminotransferase class III-fold pyridoxal phosphate-dependent enzyme [Candidatus Micrarchaeota archaeon]
EANEAAFKLARLCSKKKKILSVQGGFHGRTFASLSATYSEKYRTPFEPLVPGFQIVPDSIEEIEKAIDANTAAVIVECIQGESGVKVHSVDYLKQLRELTLEKDVLLIVDEVQTGNGRTGKFFAFQHAGIKPDIVTLAKGLGNGVPIGATISFGQLDFTPGLHGSTFGGNALACSAANFTIDYVLKYNLMQNATTVGDYFIEKLEEMNSPRVNEVRGKGLIIGMELNQEGAGIVDKCAENGLLVNCAAKTTLRFLPPLIVTKNEVDKCVEILSEVILAK